MSGPYAAEDFSAIIAEVLDSNRPKSTHEHYAARLINQQSERIEELEAERDNYQRQFHAIHETHMADKDRIAELEAQLATAKAEERERILKLLPDRMERWLATEIPCGQDDTAPADNPCRSYEKFNDTCPECKCHPHDRRSMAEDAVATMFAEEKTHDQV